MHPTREVPTTIVIVSCTKDVNTGTKITRSQAKDPETPSTNPRTSGLNLSLIAYMIVAKLPYATKVVKLVIVIARLELCAKQCIKANTDCKKKKIGMNTFVLTHPRTILVTKQDKRELRAMASVFL